MDLKYHLDQEHQLSPSAQHISEIIYGGIDGIITTFAVVAWFAGAWSENHLAQLWSLSVVLFGLANLFGDWVSMALGKYLATRSEQDLYHTAWAKEWYEIKNHTLFEHEECVEILKEQGMSYDHAHQLVWLMSHYPDIWIKWMMDNELHLSDTRQENAMIQGLITFFSFIFFGAIPLLPYLFWYTEDHWTISVVMTLIALMMLWFVRRYITRQSLIYTMMQILILGIVAAWVAYGTGFLVITYFWT